MTEISDLKRRVDAVGEKFGRLAEQENRYGERLAGLLNAVEEGFARSQRETQTLKNELASARDELTKLTADLEAARDEARRHRSELGEAKAERETLTSQLDGAKDESRQLRGMLLTLLEAVETGGQLDIGSAMRTLESRIDRIVTSTDGDTEPAPAEGEPAGADDDILMLTAKTQATSESPASSLASESLTAERPTPESLAPESLAPQSSAADSQPEESKTADSPTPEPREAFDLVDIEPDDDELELGEDALDLDEAGVDLADVVEEVATIAAETPDSADSADSTGSEDFEDFEDFEVPDVPEEPEPPRKLAAVAGKTTEPPSDDDLSAVNKIIQRISLLTGEFVEPTHKQADSDQDTTAPGLGTGKDPDEVDSPDDESAAKTK